MGKYSNVKPEAKVIPFAQNGDYFYQKGIRAYRKRDLYKARRWLQRAETINPNDASVMCQLAIVLTELGEYQRSNEYLLSILDDLAPGMNDCHYFLANNFAFLGLFQEARKHAELYMELEPDGEFIEDIDDLLDLLEIEADEEGNIEDGQDQLIIMQEKAKELLENGELDEAILLLEKIITEYPQFWSAYNNLALAHFYKGNTDRACEVLEDILEENPGNLHALCNLVVFYYKEHKDDEVEKLANKLEKVNPILVEHRYKLGATFGMIGRDEMAYKWLRTLQKNGFQGDSTFYYWLASSAFHVGHQAVAEQAWARVMALNPEKEGEAPWNVHKDATEEEEGELLAYIFFTSRLKDKKDGEDAFQFMKKQLEGPLQTQSIKEYMQYAISCNNDVPLSIKNAYAIASLYLDKVLQQSLIIDWHHFYTKVRSSNLTVSFENYHGFAAGFAYNWYKNQDKKMSQKEISYLFEVSVVSVRKYSKELVELEQFLDQ
ncbi:tetratricopeptide repeat protein [Sutcliffiella rhizosphaerae]|uniref:Tetratricopeptide repeat protein n=1 Tax=Sutcliffiella rhizosphaerae TaxID=2880967 RepID=A0ABN8ACG9_9BACI|nr:tetratricopeptide repeat protein [Sutcliffiella rhizosphaerae]CAG9620708.1 hypothetical protein BACCIP111883_01477 [Sutcliffiella rhizosphaerae]